MLTRSQLNFLIFAVLVMVVFTWGPLMAGSTSAQGESFPTSFSYQGQLNDGGVPVDGNYDYVFKLYDSASDGSQVGSTQQKTNVPVKNGFFTVELDFGSAAFKGESRWLEVQVRPAGTVSFTILEPRQHITPTPYAMHAFSIADGGEIEDNVTESLNDLENRIEALETVNADLQDRLDELEELLAGVTRQDDFEGLEGYDTLRFSGMNVQIVNGTGTTGGDTNGLGNLIVGYNELRVAGFDDRSGSHYAVIGRGNNYTSFGGIVAGSGNTVSGSYSSVTGGHLNTASGLNSSVSGGYTSKAIGYASSVSGGSYNEAIASNSSVTGGYFNKAYGACASISGGSSNIANNDYASILGGSGITVDNIYGIYPE